MILYFAAMNLRSGWTPPIFRSAVEFGQRACHRKRASDLEERRPFGILDLKRRVPPCPLRKVLRTFGVVGP
jgi:hypothetical protein